MNKNLIIFLAIFLCSNFIYKDHTSALTDGEYDLKIYQRFFSGTSEDNDLNLTEIGEFLYDLIPVSGEPSSSGSSRKKREEKQTSNISESSTTEVDQINLPTLQDSTSDDFSQSVSSDNDERLGNAITEKYFPERLSFIDPTLPQGIKDTLSEFVLKGYIDPVTFKPYARIKKPQALKLIFDYFKIIDPDNPPTYKDSSFSNLNNKYPFYAYIEYAYRNNLVKPEYRGSAKVFNKNSTFSRFEIMQIILLSTGILKESEFSEIDSIDSKGWAIFSKKYKGALFLKNVGYSNIKFLKTLSEFDKIYKKIGIQELVNWK